MGGTAMRKMRPARHTASAPLHELARGTMALDAGPRAGGWWLWHRHSGSVLSLAPRARSREACFLGVRAVLGIYAFACGLRVEKWSQAF